nr:MAG TPA: hypothetical protein [Caudoviricetes sp.]
MNAPCKNCPERHTLCHSDCVKYIAFREERDRINREKDRDNRVYRNHRRWTPRRFNGDQ